MFQQNILSELIKISYEAGLLIMDIYNNKFEVNHKKDNSPVTNADKNAEEFILKKLSNIFPDIPIISEDELEARRKNWNKPKLKVKKGSLHKYANVVSSASLGCVTDEFN